MNELEKLTAKKNKLLLFRAGIASAGTILGFVYANKTGGGFWRYVGFGIMGTMALGSAGWLTLGPKLIDIQVQIDIELKKERYREYK